MSSLSVDNKIEISDNKVRNFHIKDANFFGEVLLLLKQFFGQNRVTNFDELLI